MPIFGLGLHIIVAIVFAIHAVRTGQQLYWLMILFMFPLLGSVVYFAVIFLPALRLDRGLRKAGAVVQKSLDPGREVRDAQEAYDLTPTAHNQMRLANAFLDAGMIPAAIAQFDACLSGPFANDSEIMLGAARAKLENGQAPAALELLERLRQQAPGFRLEQVGLATARALSLVGRKAEALALFVETAQRHGSVEARVECALCAIEQRDEAALQAQLTELEHTRKHMSGYAAKMNQPWFRRLDAALAARQR